MSPPTSTPPSPRFTESADGTRVAYYELGAGPLTWVVPPAMGAPLISLLRLFELLEQDVRVVTWDMRGFQASGVPSDPEALDIPRHADDLEAVLRATGVGRFVLGGWSMAVPISLEHVRRGRIRPEALLLINGPFESALSHALPHPALSRLLVGAIDRIGEPTGRVFNPLSVRVLGAKGIGRALHRVGMIAREPEYFETILSEFRHIDWSRYFRVMRRLHEYDATAVLPRVSVPTLVVAGTRDVMTPVETAFRMVRSIPDAELFVIEGGTHYTPAEFAEPLAERIRLFLRGRVPASAES